MVARKAWWCALLVGTSAALFAASAPGFKSTGSAVQLIAVVPETLGLQLLAPSVGLDQKRGYAWAEQPITIITSWNLVRSRAKVVVNAYFEAPNGTTIALGDVSSGRAGRPGELTAGPGTMFATPWNGADAKPLEVFVQRLTPGVNDMSSRTDNVDAILGRTHRDGISAGRHNGVLTLVAEAY